MRQLLLLKPFIDAFSELTSSIKNGHAVANPAVDAKVWKNVQGVAWMYLIIMFPKGIANYASFYWIASATNRIATKLRDDIYEHLHKLSLSYFERNRIGHLMSRITNDVSLIQNGSGTVVDMLTAPAQVILGLGVMIFISWKLMLVVVAFIPIMSWLVSKITRKMRSLTMDLQIKLADVVAVLEETIAGVRIVKSFGMEDREVRRFQKNNDASLRSALRAARRNAAVTPLTEMFGTFAIVTIILVGGWLVNHHEMTLGSFFVFGGAGFYVNSSAKKIGRLNVTYHQMMAGTERVFEVLDEQPDIKDSPNAVDLGDIDGQVEFGNVSFSYQTGEQVLTDISFVMEPGKVVAVVGPSGSGKSTIANIIPRFYDVTGGAVLVDGHDIREVTVASLRKHIGIVPQESILFSGTIRDNIAYGKPNATDEEIESAARAANAHDFVTQFEDGYNTILGERGARLSGGERQRISIARAILKDPRILILDEATSSLDATSERLVQDALDKLMQGRTTLVIAHRLSTITNADKIIVLASGSIVEQGSFDDLTSRTDGLFAKLYRSQFDTQMAAMAGVSDPVEGPVE